MRQSLGSWLVAFSALGLLGGILNAEEQPASPAEDVTDLKMTVVSSQATEGSSTGLAESAPMRVSMEFQDANLKDVLKTFSQQTGINVIASEEVGDRAITLYLEDVTVLDALDQILKASNLVYERPAGSQIYIVKPQPEVEEEKIATVTKIYRLKFARVSTSRLAKVAEALGSVTPFEALQLTRAISGVTAAGGTGGGGGFGGQIEEIGIDKVIDKLLTDQGSVVVDERTNSLIVTDLPDNFPRIEATLNVLDVKTAQILIETEVLETTLSKLKDLGIEWGVGSEGELLKFRPTLMSLDPFNPFRKQDIASKFELEDTTVGDIDVTFTGSRQAAFALLDATSVNAILQALERDTDTKVLARPKVLTMDNESAVIRLTSQQAVAFGSVTVGETGNVTTSVERMMTGVILVVTPQVNEDGFVTMLVEPSVTKVVAAQVTPPPNFGTVVDPRTRSARALVRIRQGETLVLGGLIDRSESERMQRVPILSGIPVIGEAFKNKEVDNSATELIVFVTPRVLGEPLEAGTKVAAAQAPFAAREQEETPSRHEMIEQTLQRLE